MSAMDMGRFHGYIALRNATGVFKPINTLNFGVTLGAYFTLVKNQLELGS